MRLFPILLLAVFLCSGCAQHYAGLRLTPAAKTDIPIFVAAVDAIAKEFSFQRVAIFEGVHSDPVFPRHSLVPYRQIEINTLRHYSGGPHRSIDTFVANFDPEYRTLEVNALAPHFPHYPRPPREDLQQRDLILAHLVEQLLHSFPAEHIYLRPERDVIQFEGVSLTRHPLKTTPRPHFE